MANCTTYLYDDSRLGCALPSGHDGPHVTGSGRGWHDSDDMDGGVTAALIEKEAERGTRGTATDSALARYWLKEYDRAEARAEQAEKERDEWKDSAIKAMADLERAEHPRPLTPRQNLAALWESAHRPVGGRIPAGTAIITRSDHGSGDVRYQTLEATGRDLPDPGYTLERNYNYGPENGREYRLLDPPARPEGAERIEAILAELPDTMLPVTDAGRADLLASRGVRVVTEEQP